MPKTLANTISVIMHPGLMPTLLFALLMLSGKGLIPEAQGFRLTLLGLIFNFTFLLPLLLIIMLYVRGYLSSIKIANRQERMTPFILISACYVLLAWLFYLKLPNLFMLYRLMACIALTQVISTLITAKFKISIHSIALAGTLGALLALQILMPELEFMYLIVVFSALLGITMTARLALNAHTPEQVNWGAAFGFSINFFGLLILEWA